MRHRPPAHKQTDTELLGDFFELGGFVTNPCHVSHHLKVLKKLGEKESWSRYLMYLVLHDEAEAEVRRQIRFGKGMHQTALRMAEDIHDVKTRPPSAMGTLIRAGELRMGTAKERPSNPNLNES